jgi:ABC-type branched-subunit amino acid transport system permease subunit
VTIACEGGRGAPVAGDWEAHVRGYPAFIVIIGGIGTVEGPIVGTAVFFGIGELFANVFALTGSWYLIALGTVAVIAVVVAPPASGRADQAAGRCRISMPSSSAPVTTD